jgi:hypothetical protein
MVAEVSPNGKAARSIFRVIGVGDAMPPIKLRWAVAHGAPY